MPLHVVRLGSARLEEEGLRIGTVRRPPRGVPKAEFAPRNFYDVWLPDLAPTEPLHVGEFLVFHHRGGVSVAVERFHI